uniref:CalliFMRFamide-12 n=1 Tax=Calliphora vomitoria TaxID=27454 RepID=FARC_CALVO|nr:RecName: Full=CalliFMRFamide-12 [Calliphora vomitoria]
AAGQDNFMRF